MTTLTHNPGKDKNSLLKKYHTLCGRVGLNDDTRRAMLVRNYRVQSSRDLTVLELADVCNILERELNPELEEMDKLRKRLIKSIDAWLELTGKEKNISIIKAIACRASKRKHFNQMPKEQLRSLSALFSNAQKDQRAVNELILEIL